METQKLSSQEEIITCAPEQTDQQEIIACAPEQTGQQEIIACAPEQTDSDVDDKIDKKSESEIDYWETTFKKIYYELGAGGI